MTPGGPSSLPQPDERGSARRRQIENIITAVLRLPEAQRAAYLDRVCASDSGLRRDVDSMVAMESQAQGFLETPVLDTQTLIISETDDAVAGQVISHYRILGKIGAGGMGVVYKGQDLKLGRMVALKTLPGGLSLDRAAVQRFQLEARAASALNHPHICTV